MLPYSSDGPLVHPDPKYSAQIKSEFARYARELFGVELDPRDPASDRPAAERLAVLFTYGFALAHGEMIRDIRRFVAEGMASGSEEVRREATLWLDRPLSIFDPEEQVMREAVLQIIGGDGRSANAQARANTGLSKNFLDNVRMEWMPTVEQQAVISSVSASSMWVTATYNATQSLGWVFVPGGSAPPIGPFPADERAVEFALYRLALAAAQPHSGVSARGEAQIREAIAEALERSYTAALAVGLDASSTSATYVAAEEVIAAVRELGTGSAVDNLSPDA